MLQNFPVRSLLMGCLFWSVAAVAVLPTVAQAKPLIAQQSTKLPDSKTIADQVLKQAIAKEKLDKTARAVIERTGKGDMWMYNPVPYWKVTIVDARNRLVYFTNDNGMFRILMERNGQKTHAPGQPAREVPPPNMVSEAVRQARFWGYTGPTSVWAVKTTWSSGCENISFPQQCDPIVRKGWKITIPQKGTDRWVLRGETAQDLELIERSNAIEKQLPRKVRDEIKRIASNQLQIPQSIVLITNVESKTFSDGCLGVGSLAESCTQALVPGYRVTVAGKPNDRQIYRISTNTSALRTEAIAGLPVRTDELPTTIARTVFNRAQTDLKTPIANLNIQQVEKTFDCYRNPTAAPNEPCLPIKRINGWKVTVTNYQRSRLYTVNLNGTIGSNPLAN